MEADTVHITAKACQPEIKPQQTLKQGCWIGSMEVMYPPKLQSGDRIRVIAPSQGLNIISGPVRKVANRRLAELELQLDYGANVENTGPMGVAPVADRLDDLHKAFADPTVKAVITVIGGYHANQLLGGLDYQLLKENPKIFCGYSDISVLANAIFAQTGMVTYSGPHYSTFGMEQGLEDTLSWFRQCLFSDKPFNIEPSRKWSDDPWFLDQENRRFEPNIGTVVVNHGVAEGRIVGGNIGTFGLLRGTQYMPDLNGTILFLEDDSLLGPATLDEFARQLQSLTQQPGFSGVKGLVLGRFQRDSVVNLSQVHNMIATIPALNLLPVIANADFGHTSPLITFPVGGFVRISALDNQVTVELLEH